LEHIFNEAIFVAPKVYGGKTDDYEYVRIKGLLDAANIQLLVKYLNLLNYKDINLYTIHDCFASDYKSMHLIELLVKKSIADLYFKENYLELIHKSLLHQIQEVVNIYNDETRDIETNEKIEIKRIYLKPKSKNNKVLVTNLIKENINLRDGL
jgi:hypothetical protein